ncbi:bifunctional transcriptional activator/DNA repair enzyme AdaA [Alicyclobacillus sp. ALC3]|uniref:bifunctional transcriptional activator/DNA repair enzyme AdaA n=1 Tax=Alicyclobacillus sp. ALC3 TaxID=2796143 RepID=UPI002378F4F4|nr:helix-turn-helix domain-containing protein [Alicyclobacillus sp. ALC3]WDL98540.1 methylphosphotriester-DNA--protein-cysteine methyltransferase family protein [Alicyclobacillus sp. ALC3]
MQDVTDELYETMKRRDTNFDGQLYIGIVSTGIVCFPSCRSRLPNRENVRVFPGLDEALRAGFRPCKRCKPDNPKQMSPDAEIANRVLEILTSRYQEALTLQELADELNVSPYHLQRTFKRFTGHSPAGGLRRIRMQRAQDYLRTTADSVGAIALRVGYESASHFSATFRKEFGICPHDYRSSLRPDQARP